MICQLLRLFNNIGKWMNGVCSKGGMMMTGEYCHTQREIRPNCTLSTINPCWMTWNWTWASVVRGWWMSQPWHSPFPILVVTKIFLVTKLDLCLKYCWEYSVLWKTRTGSKVGHCTVLDMDRSQSLAFVKTVMNMRILKTMAMSWFQM